MRNRGIQCCNCGNSDSDMYCFDCYAEECSSCQRHEKKIYKLKLERLMYKCQHRLTWLSDYVDSAPYGEERDVWEVKYDRCYKIYNGCFNALEELKK